jgi:Asparaginase
MRLYDLRDGPYFYISRNDLPERNKKFLNPSKINLAVKMTALHTGGAQMNNFSAFNRLLRLSSIRLACFTPIAFSAIANAQPLPPSIPPTNSLAKTPSVTAVNVAVNVPEKGVRPFTIVIHGGSGTITRENLTPEIESRYRAALDRALAAGYAVLEAGHLAVAV